MIETDVDTPAARLLKLGIANPFKPGQRWRSRNGLIFKVTEIIPNISYAIRGVAESGSVIPAAACWTLLGTFYSERMEGYKYPHRFDLVELLD